MNILFLCRSVVRVQLRPQSSGGERCCRAGPGERVGEPGVCRGKTRGRKTLSCYRPISAPFPSFCWDLLCATPGGCFSPAGNGALLWRPFRFHSQPHRLHATARSAARLALSRTAGLGTRRGRSQQGCFVMEVRAIPGLILPVMPDLKKAGTRSLCCFLF